MTRFRDHLSRRLGRTIPPELEFHTVGKVGIIVKEIEEMAGRRVEGADPKAELSVAL